MTTTPTMAYSLTSDQGEALWFLGTLMTVKAGAAQTGGGLTLLECVLPAGFAPPPHLHEAEDEAFYLLDGGLAVRCGEASFDIAPGGFVYLPRGIVHGFSVHPTAPARMLQFTTPAGFEGFIREFGQPATVRTLPAPSVPDVERLVQVAARYGYRIMGPPPGHE